MASTVPVEVVEQFWTAIEPYVDVVSLISVSKSCHPLRNLVVDAESGNIKSSSVTIKNTLDTVPTDVENKRKIDWTSSSSKLHYAPHVLNTLHFQSLTRLDIGFPPNLAKWNGRKTVDPSAFRVAFPMFAIEADNLCNLEELCITVNSLIVHEKDGALQSSFEILGENLATCIRRTRKLRKLKICNENMLEDGKSKFSAAFLAAMIPVIQAGLLSLEEVSIACGDEPSCTDFPNVGRDFFKAVLNLQNLRKLEVRIRSFGPLLKDFLDNATSVNNMLGRFPSESLEDVVFMVQPYQEGDSLRPSVLPLLSLCRNTPTLLSVGLWLPPECWGANSMDAFVHLLKESRILEKVSINFYGYKDTSGRLIAYLTNFVEESVDDNFRLHLFGIGNVPEQSESFKALGSHARKVECQGEDCKLCKAKFCGILEFTSLHNPQSKVIK